MVEEAVIFPSAPLFMVDRGWQRQRKKGRKGPALEGAEDPRSRVPEVTIMAKKPTPKTNEMPITLSSADDVNKRRLKRTLEFQFMSYEPHQPVKTQEGGNRHRVLSSGKKSRVKQESTLPDHRAPGNSSSSDFKTQISPVLGMPVSGSTFPVYAVIDPEVRAFQGLLNYYPGRLATAIFPICKFVPFQFNPIKTIWFPTAVTDEVLLHTILFSSAIHLYASQHHDFKDSELLMKVILNRLNRRISDGKISDATIGAVSCLALCENEVGNHKKWQVHMAGMSEMIRVRGGMSSIQDGMRMKIHRADIIGAVDTLSRPRLPRPVRTTRSLYQLMEIDSSPETPLVTILIDAGVAPELLNSFIELSQLCEALEHAMRNNIAIDPRAFDEDVICIQHDLLGFEYQQQGSIEKVCQLAALVFIQTLTRENPFSWTSSYLVSETLQHTLLALDNEEEFAAQLAFWILFMGGIVSAETKEKQWYRTKLGEHRGLRNNLGRWENAKIQLKKIMWIEEAQEKYGIKLWHDINPHIYLSID